MTPRCASGPSVSEPPVSEPRPLFLSRDCQGAVLRVATEPRPLFLSRDCQGAVLRVVTEPRPSGSGLIDRRAVSYTHLDVYKRQEQTLSSFLPNLVVRSAMKDLGAGGVPHSANENAGGGGAAVEGVSRVDDASLEKMKMCIRDRLHVARYLSKRKHTHRRHIAAQSEADIHFSQL